MAEVIEAGLVAELALAAIPAMFNWYNSVSSNFGDQDREMQEYVAAMKKGMLHLQRYSALGSDALFQPLKVAIKWGDKLFKEAYNARSEYKRGRWTAPAFKWSRGGFSVQLDQRRKEIEDKVKTLLMEHPNLGDSKPSPSGNQNPTTPGYALPPQSIPVYAQPHLYAPGSSAGVYSAPVYLPQVFRPPQVIMYMQPQGVQFIRHWGPDKPELEEKLGVDCLTIEEAAKNLFKPMKIGAIEKDGYRFKIFHDGKEVPLNSPPEEDLRYELRQEAEFEVNDAIEEIFLAMDKDQDEALNMQEAWVFQKVQCEICGDPVPSEEDWPTRYVQLGEMCGYDPAEGVPKADVEKILGSFSLDSLKKVIQVSLYSEGFCG